MAHLRPIPKHKCLNCKKPATVELYNRYNAPYGYFCGVCGKRREAQLNSDEKATK